MTRTSSTASEAEIAVWAITPNGASLASKIAAGVPKADVYVAQKIGGPAEASCFESLAQAVAGCFHRYTGHVFIMATGIVVRTVAPLMFHKSRDPAVVVADDRGQFAISLLSGHLGGANKLAEQVAAAIGAKPVITTATDVNGVPAIDVLAAEAGIIIENPQAIKTVNMALLTGAAVEVHDPFGLLSNRIPNARAVGPGGPLVPRVFVDDRLLDAPPGALILRPPSLVAGIGCNRGTAADEIRGLLLATLQEAGLCRASLRGLASIDLKADEPGLIALTQELGLPIAIFSRQEINGVGGAVQTPSAMVEKHIGVKSVCEATAILATRGGELVVPKRTTRNATVAIARVNFTS
jgi:cobalt-precorrin 5A hydrolase